MDPTPQTSRPEPASGDQLRANLRAVRERIAAACARAGRDPASVHVLAATKYVDAGTVIALVDAGVVDVAENRLDSLELKRPAVDRADATWHYIGRLQSRKATAIAAHVDVIHTLTSESAARRLATWAQEGNRLPRIFVQVNAADDPAKDGVAPGELDAFLGALPQEIAIDGLMTMPALAETAEHSRAAFASLHELAAGLQPLHAGRHGLGSLSMGTSQDFDVAVEEGATHVRLGRILYGVEEYVPH